MAEESGLVVGRRGRAESARLAGLYRTSGMGRSEFCRIHGLALSTLGRHLKKQSKEQAGSNEVGSSRLVAVEVAATLAQAATGKRSDVLTVLLSNGRKPTFVLIQIDKRERLHVFLVGFANIRVCRRGFCQGDLSIPHLKIVEETD
ncbi:MAG: hypothetical protein ABSG62_15005 [Terracidiphilus sp.]|jgi:hypothetical protein